MNLVFLQNVVLQHQRLSADVLSDWIKLREQNLVPVVGVCVWRRQNKLSFNRKWLKHMMWNRSNLPSTIHEACFYRNPLCSNGLVWILVVDLNDPFGWTWADHSWFTGFWFRSTRTSSFGFQANFYSFPASQFSRNVFRSVFIKETS